ncbi:MAG: Gfo/Idh/MocA family oxidoreductase [Rikenellaceae bacterium]|jgi:predicted dehydrogenase|nr:Gfo/Idh/MocA family oxidoreductase [Rikenellaceae bacterium]
MEQKTISRREFLKEMGLVAGVSLLASSPWFSAFAQEQETQKEKARLAVIGTGSRGCFHLNMFVRDPKCEVVAICDDYRPSIDAALKITPHANVYTVYRKLLEDPNVDGVLIATPLHLHREMVEASFQAGKHVFCEKSLSKTLDDALAIYKAYQNTDKVLFVGQQRLFDPRYIKAIEMIEQGVIGPIQGIKTFWYRNNDWRRPVPSPELERKINWRLYREFSLGMMTELACHQVQLGSWALKELPNRMMGSGSLTWWKDGREVYDNVSILYLYDSGVRMSFDSIISNKFYGCEEQIMGHEGTIEPEKGKFFYETIPPAAGILQLVNEAEKGIFESIPFAGPSWVPETANKNKGEFLIGEKPKEDGSRLTDRAFVEAVITGKRVEKLVEEGYYATTLSILGDQAMQEGRIIDYPDEYKIDYLNHKAPSALAPAAPENV